MFGTNNPSLLTLVLIVNEPRHRRSSASKYVECLVQTRIQPKQCHKSVAYLLRGEVASHYSPEQLKSYEQSTKLVSKASLEDTDRKKNLGILGEERCDILHLYRVLEWRCSNGSSVDLFKHLFGLGEFCSSTDPLSYVFGINKEKNVIS